MFHSWRPLPGWQGRSRTGSALPPDQSGMVMQYAVVLYSSSKAGSPG